MRRARVYCKNEFAGHLEELERGKAYRFCYDENYVGAGISLTMPRQTGHYEFQSFPPFFEGLLPEGAQLEAMLRENKIDRGDLFAQLLLVGEDLVGVVTVKAAD